VRAHYENELVQMKKIEPPDQPVQLWKSPRSQKKAFDSIHLKRAQSRKITQYKNVIKLLLRVIKEVTLEFPSSLREGHITCGLTTSAPNNWFERALFSDLF